MADLSIFKKYPDSWRVDHPDFGDVRKTIYVKGVITDFKVDDPANIIGSIKSPVKVKGDFGESDYIPIFFHPKKQYWDDENHQAQDFNKEKKYFERAWMSFRCDDEVAVMLYENIPVAAICFADGVPRIGENIVRAQCPPITPGDPPNDYSWKLIPTGDYEAYKENGPDGQPLNLRKEAEHAEGGETIQHGQDQWTERDLGSYDPGGGHVVCLHGIEECFWNNPPWGGGQADCQAIIDWCYANTGDTEVTIRDPITTGGYYFGPALNSHYKVRVYVFVIGPILCAVYFVLYSESYAPGGGYYLINVPYYVAGFQDWCSSEDWEVPPPVFGSWDPEQGPITPGESGKNFSAMQSITKFGLYSKKLYDKVLSTVGPVAFDEGGTPLVDFCPWTPSELKIIWKTIEYMGYEFEVPEDIGALVSGWYNESWYVDGIKFSVRPHTKEDLQAAGMWPEGS